MVRSRMAQAVSRRLLVADGPNAPGRAERKALSIARRALIRWGGDPSVTTQLASTCVYLPLSHQLPYYRRSYPEYSSNLTLIARLVSAARPGRPIIDIGANIGDSAAFIKDGAPDAAILCVDADPRYLPFLRANTAQWSDVELAAPVLLGARSTTSMAAIRASGGTSFVENSGMIEHSFLSLDDLLEQRPRYKMPALVKSDTDGFEQHILLGAENTLRAGLPLLFIEYDPTMLKRSGGDGPQMLTWLCDIGYESIAFYDNFGHLLVRLKLGDRGIEADLSRYVSATGRAFHYFDIVVAGPADRHIIDALAGPIL